MRCVWLKVQSATGSGWLNGSVVGRAMKREKIVEDERHEA